MNMQTSSVMAPPAPKGLGEMQLPLVMMRDILLKTVFRKNVDTVSEIAASICLAEFGDAGIGRHRPRTEAA